MDYLVGNAAELTAALKVVQSGDTVKLASGSYGAVQIKRDLGGVTITSADSAHEAQFSNVTVVNGGGVTLKNLDVTVASGGTGVDVTNSSNVTLTGLNIHGQTIGTNAWAGKGVNVRSSTNVTVANNELHELRFGIAHLNDQHVAFDNNYVHQISEDGIRGGGSSYIEVSGNVFTDFYRLGTVHPDAIQFWTAGQTTAAHDITITNNTYVRGAGTATQGVFMGDENHVTYQNVTITGNQIVGAMYHGISLYGGDGATISGNTVEGYQGQDSWIMAKNSSHVTVTGNIATDLKQVSDTATTFANNTKIALGAVGDLSALKSSISTLLSSFHTTLGSAVAATVEVPSVHVVAGTAGADVLNGTSGSDLIDGKGGADTMAGGAGDDAYIVDNAKDVVVESANGGTDTVQTSLAKYTLADNVENLQLVGSAKSQLGIGNSLDNTLEANASAATSSTLVAGSGEDTLIAHGGAATLQGGTGNDVFVFSQAPNSAAQIIDYHAGDKIDLSALFSPDQTSDPVADGFVKVQMSAGVANVMVDLDGPSGPSGWLTIAQVHGMGGASVAPDFVF